MNPAKWLSRPVSEEFSGADWGDPRRNRRLCGIADTLSEDASASFPKLFSSSAELEGFYRFLRNDAVEWADVLTPHRQATYRRAEQLGECLVLHDTTQFVFQGQREGLGFTCTERQGFLAHFSLMVANDEARTPLGVAALKQYVRTQRKGKMSSRERAKDPASESNRWLEGVRTVRESCNASCIHVADREGDNLKRLTELLELGRFVVRVSYDRRVLDEDDEAVRLHQVLLETKARTRRSMTLSARGKGLNPKMNRRYPARSGRRATVCVGATSVYLTSTECFRGQDIEVNLVRVWEPRPPKGQPPVEWILWTTEPVDTAEQMNRVVDIYRARWLIEEYFKALKTGCQFERRQLESFDTLSTALALFAPVAWKLLLARTVSRFAPERPASDVLTPLQITYLERKYNQPVHNARQALLAVAKLGGHIKQNGEPGWLVLGRGYEELLVGEAFYQVLTQSER
jgi:hypothetical protein